MTVVGPAPPRVVAMPNDTPGRKAVDPWHVETALVHGGRPPAVPGAPLNTPIEPASTYRAGGAIEYARDGTAGTEALEGAVGPLEGGGAVAFASGMAAANAIMDVIPAGSGGTARPPVIVAAEFTYTGVAMRLRELDDRGAIRLRRVDIANTDAVLAALPGATALWIESPTNPMLEVADVPALADAAHAVGALVVCDNTFATPLGQRPLDLGADVVLHSATKAMGGHSDCLLGIAITADDVRLQSLRLRRTLMGAAPGALECYLVLRGLRTLGLRHARAQASAQVIAERLAAHPAISRVRYPGLPSDPGYARCREHMSGPGSMISIEAAGGAEAAQRLTESTRLWVHATSLGGVESLLERRRRWDAENPAVPESLVRMSVGVEDVEDLWADLEQALATIT